MCSIFLTKRKKNIVKKCSTNGCFDTFGHKINFSTLLYVKKLNKTNEIVPNVILYICAPFDHPAGDLTFESTLRNPIYAGMHGGACRSIWTIQPRDVEVWIGQLQAMRFPRIMLLSFVQLLFYNYASCFPNSNAVQRDANHASHLWYSDVLSDYKSLTRQIIFRNKPLMYQCIKVHCHHKDYGRHSIKSVLHWQNWPNSAYLSHFLKSYSNLLFCYNCSY